MPLTIGNHRDLRAIRSKHDPYEPDDIDRGRGDKDAFRGFLYALAIMAPVYALLLWMLWPSQ